MTIPDCRRILSGLPALVLAAGCAVSPEVKKTDGEEKPEVLYLDFDSAAAHFEGQYGCIGVARKPRFDDSQECRRKST